MMPLTNRSASSNPFCKALIVLNIFRSLFILLLGILSLFFLPTPWSIAQASGNPTMPTSVASLAEQIQGRSPAEVQALIVKRFGPAHRDNGSGLSIPQWDVAGGILQFHPLAGPSYFDPKTNKTTGLIRTHNAVRDNLLRPYEMTTLPHANGTNHHGNLTFSADSRYSFEPANYRISAAERNFFFDHPTGTISVFFMQGISNATLLESLGEQTSIARLTFKSADGKTIANYFIKSFRESRLLRFSDDKDMNFLMDKSWESFWK